MPDFLRLSETETAVATILRLRTRRHRLVFSLLAAFLLSVFTAWLASQITGFPQPTVHDEFCYLLSGETFASGRLAMPEHPMGYFFQTFHQLQTPAYVAKYPPGQGLVLAVGFLLGDPIYGVWLLIGLLGSAMVWMLAGFCRVRWAFIGGVAAGVWFGGFSYWAQSYWGGALTATGAALLWGATRRFYVNPRAGIAVLIGTGIAILFLTRPFDGALACLVPLAVLLLRMVGSLQLGRLSADFLRLSVAALPLLAAVVFQIACNQAATGNPWKLPYTEYRDQYDRNPILVWEKPRVPPVFDHARMEQFDIEVQERTAVAPKVLLPLLSERVEVFARFYTGGLAPLFILSLFFIWPSRWALISLTAVAVSLTSALWVYAYYFHYIAAAAAPLTLAFVAAGRTLWVRFPHRRHTLVAISLALFVIMLCIRQSVITYHPPLVEHRGHRVAIAQKLTTEPGEHLVVVKYERGLDAQVEYVFNGAHIDQQPIIWARWTSDAGTRGLYDYYEGRRLWLLTVRPKGEPRLREFAWVPGSE